MPFEIVRNDITRMNRKKHNLLDMVDIKPVHAKNKEKQSHWDRSCSPG